MIELAIMALIAVLIGVSCAGVTLGAEWFDVTIILPVLTALGMRK